MKSRLLLIPAMLATTAGLGLSGTAFSTELDAQAQAAAVLSPSYAPISAGTLDNGTPSSQPAAADAHAHAAALLRGARTGQAARTSERVAASRADRTSLDAQAHAAALLSRARITVDESTRISTTSERSDEHPAVVVARAWSTRGVDPNTFIVAHPARLQLVAASPTEKGTQRALSEVVTASTEVAPALTTNGALPTEGSSP